MHYPGAARRNPARGHVSRMAGEKQQPSERLAPLRKRARIGAEVDNPAANGPLSDSTVQSVPQGLSITKRQVPSA